MSMMRMQRGGLGRPRRVLTSLLSLVGPPRPWRPVRLMIWAGRWTGT